MKDVVVVKIGGFTLDKRDTTVKDIVSIQKQGRPLIIVHGGGNAVTGWLKRQGVETRFVNGERVTDAAVLEVVVAVLAGLVNKQLVAAIHSRGGRAVGISGVDGALIESRMRDKDMGYVGMVVRVNPQPLEALLAAGFVPVVSPVSLYSVDRPSDAAPIININGDPIAGELAVALKAARLVFLTGVEGVSDRSGRLIEKLTAAEAEALIASGVASGGMVPKINACRRALGAGAVTRIIDGRPPHALLNELGGKGGGTTICR
jgi:acetylglutamate kinase